MSEMTEMEVKTIRWVEHVLAPLLVASVLMLTTCASKTTDAVDGLKTTVKVMQKEQQSMDEVNGETKQAIKDLETQQGEILESQHEIEVTVKQIETHQEHFKGDLEEMKHTNDTIRDQNVEILRILMEIKR